MKESTVIGDTSYRRPVNRSRINLEEDCEVRYWARAFNIPEERLRDAVGAVGCSVYRVREYLGRSGRRLRIARESRAPEVSSA